jgi:AcrR family transcriptional regulator
MPKNDRDSYQRQDVNLVTSGETRAPAPYHHGDLRRALLTEAVRQVEQHGIEGLSLRKISARAGVSHAAAYHHFADKGALMTAITAEAFAGLADALRPCRELPGTPVDRLTALGVAYVRFGYQHRGQFLVMWRPELRDPAREPEVIAAGDEAYAIIRAAVQDCHDHAGGPSYETPVMTIGAWAMAHGIAALAVDGPLSKWMTSIDDLTAMATAIIRNTAESLYAPRRP